MILQPANDGTYRMLGESALIVISVADAVKLSDWHPMRAAHCVSCHEVIGDRPVTVIGAAALGGDACVNGCIGSDMYLVHADCNPAEPSELVAELQLAMLCTRPHPWQ